MPNISFRGNSEFNVLYFNDIHSKTKNCGKFKNAVDEFDKQNKDKYTLKLAGGDLSFASDLNPNKLIFKLMNLIGLDATCIGNHEVEGGDYWIKAYKQAKSKFKYLSANLSFNRKNIMEDNIAKSTIIEKEIKTEKDGKIVTLKDKVGVIGITALDTEELIFRSNFNNYVNVENFHKTVCAIKEEIKKLENEGIKKIFLLAHTGEKSKEGFEYYKNLAQIGGIDVIIGGHDHYELDKWFTSRRGEPVKVVSTESDNDFGAKELDSFGILKATFDDNGVLIPQKCQNKIIKTINYPDSTEVNDLIEKYLENKKIVCSNSNSLTCDTRKIKEDPVADLLADSMLWIADKVYPQSKVQIALINSGEIKSDLPKGNLTMKNIKNSYPFTHNVTMVETTFSKKELFEALNRGVTTTTFPKKTLGLLQVGGLKYTVGKDNKVKNVYLVNRDGSRGECLDNMPDNKEYTVVYDTYLMKGTGGLDSLKREPTDSNVKIYPYNHQSGVIEYLNRNFENKPVEVQTGRITLEQKPLTSKEQLKATSVNILLCHTL